MKLRARRQMTKAALGVAVVVFLVLLILVIWRAQGQAGQGLASITLHGFGVLLLEAFVVAPLIGELKRLSVLEKQAGPDADLPFRLRLTSGHVAVLLFLAGVALMILLPRILAAR